MTTMYMVLETIWEKNAFDGIDLTEGVSVWNMPVYKTLAEASGAMRQNTQASVGDMMFLEFEYGLFDHTIISEFDPDAWDNERYINEFIDWADANDVQWWKALPNFWQIKEIEVPNTCNKLAGQEKDAKIAALEKQLAKLQLKYNLVSSWKGKKPHLPPKTYKKGGQLKKYSGNQYLESE